MYYIFIYISEPISNRPKNYSLYRINGYNRSNGHTSNLKLILSLWFNFMLLFSLYFSFYINVLCYFYFNNYFYY